MHRLRAIAGPVSIQGGKTHAPSEDEVPANGQRGEAAPGGSAARGLVGVLAGVLLLPLHVGAVGSGDLDSSFGGDGKVTNSFGSGSYDLATAYAVAIQSDGKIVVVGNSAASGPSASGRSAFALARYLPNGTMGPSSRSSPSAVPQSIRPFAASPLGLMDIWTRAVFINRSG
jgi:hypothetical protein